MRRGLGGDDDLDKGPAYRLGRGGIERAVERHDPAIGALRVAGERSAPGLAQARCDGDTARIGVLDDRHRRRRQLGDQLERGVGVGIVVVRQLLTVQLPGAGDTGRGSPVR